MINKKSMQIIIIISIFFLTAFLFVSTISAATISVKANNADGIKGAIAKSNNGDTIELSPGTYSGSNNRALSLSKNVIITGKGSAQSVVINAQKIDRFFIIAGQANVVFKNITFTKGNNNNPFDPGNILVNSGSTVTFINCKFTYNSAVMGAGIYNKGNCKVVNSTFSNNVALLDGGIHNFEGGKLTVTDSNFTNNNITGYGGAITNYKSSCTITGSIFKKNSGNNSGGLYNDQGTAILKNSILKNNKFAGIMNTGTITVKDNTLSGNPAGDFLSNGTVKDESRLKTYLSLSKFQAKYGKKTTFKATLKNNLKKPMKNKYISFYSNNTYLGKVKTNAKGIAILTKKVTKKGSVSFIAKYGGTKTYRNSSYTRKVTVK